MTCCQDGRDTIRAKFIALRPVMDERVRRLWTGAEVAGLGDGGIAALNLLRVSPARVIIAAMTTLLHLTRALFDGALEFSAREAAIVFGLPGTVFGFGAGVWIAARMLD